MIPTKWALSCLLDRQYQKSKDSRFEIFYPSITYQKLIGINWCSMPQIWPTNMTWHLYRHVLVSWRGALRHMTSRYGLVWSNSNRADFVLGITYFAARNNFIFGEKPTLNNIFFNIKSKNRVLEIILETFKKVSRN